MSALVWKPTEEYVSRSNVKRLMDKQRIGTYEELVRRSAEVPEWFWEAALQDLAVEWFQPYTKIVDASAGFPWTKWFLGGKLNIVHNCLDRHARSWRRNKLALIWEGEDGFVKKYTYRDLYVEVNRLANALKALSVKRGDVVGIYMPMIPEVCISVLAALKVGAIVTPVFSGFGASAVASRLADVEAKVLLTVDGFLRAGKTVAAKAVVDEVSTLVKTLEHIIVVKRLGVEVPWNSGKDLWMHEAVANQPSDCPTEVMNSEDYALVLYTSGTTGKPKGVVQTHAGALAQCAKEISYNLDLQEADVFMWVTEMGWMMGPWMLIGVQHLGGTYLIFEGAIDHPSPDRLWAMMERHGVSHLGISPTAIRLLKKYGKEPIKRGNLENLRILASTGEPWDHESWMWFFEKVGGGRCPIVNISGGTEIIGCLLASSPLMPLKPCSLGQALAMDVDVFDDEGKPIRGAVGYLVCKKHAPSMTRGFWRDPQRYLDTYFSRWPGVWYHGDWASIDEDGFWFLHGRADDVIKISGRRLGPAEVENAVMEHPAVAEAAAIGVPHDIKGEALLCFVVLKPNYLVSDELREELKLQVVKALGKPFKPDEVKFVKAIPKTRNQKIMRRIIRAKHLGAKDLGDLSTLEDPEAVEEIAKAE